MNAYKKFFRNLLIYALIFLATDRIFGLFFRPVFYRQERGKYFTTSYALRKSGEDILIFGNSHAAQHFNTCRLTDSLHTEAFNFGNQAQSILYYYPVLESLLTHHIPKLVILNVDPDEFTYNRIDYERLSILLPYKNENARIDSSIRLINRLEPYKSISNYYRFNSTIGYVLLSLFNKSYGKSLSSRGFDPQDGSLCKPLAANDQPGPEKDAPAEGSDNENNLDTLKIRYFCGIIEDLKKDNVNLMVTISPAYRSVIRNEASLKKLTSIIAQNHVGFFNYYSDERFIHNCALFHDGNHLNITGANMFTDLVMREIRDKHLTIRGTYVPPPGL